jgi:hypothetical protein
MPTVRAETSIFIGCMQCPYSRFKDQTHNSLGISIRNSRYTCSLVPPVSVDEKFHVEMKNNGIPAINDISNPAWCPLERMDDILFHGYEERYFYNNAEETVY